MEGRTSYQGGHASGLGFLAAHKQLWLKLLFVYLGVMFGGTFIAMKWVVASISPLQAASLRVIIAFLILGAIYLTRRNRVKLPRQILPEVWISGLLLQAVPFFLMFWGIQHISAGLGGILEGSIPIFAFIFAIVLVKGKQEFALNKAIGLIFGIVGIVFVFSDKLHISGKVNEIFGSIAFVVMSAAYALGTTMNRRILQKHDKKILPALMLHQHLSSVVLLTILTLGIEGVPNWTAATFTWPVIAGIAYLAIGCTAVACSVYVILIREWGAVRAASVHYVVPTMAVFLDFLFYMHVPTGAECLGSIAILIGVFLLQQEPSQLIKIKEMIRVTFGIQSHTAAMGGASDA